MFTIEGSQLIVKVKNKGAELDSIYSKEIKMEYLWSGDPSFWPKKSPVLFPIVGTLKENTYYYNNKAYHLTRHGFARDMDFTMTAQSADSVTMTLISDDKTLSVFPFRFQLDIIYSVKGNELFVKYKVTNTGEENMYFSIGAHPAFRLPLEEGLEYHDYYFEFSDTEDALRWMISREGLIEPVAIPFIINDNKLSITRELFKKDAVVFKYLNSERIKLKSDKTIHGLEVHYPRFPFIGLWSAPNADFICIEPWCGIADSTTSGQQLVNKEGISVLTEQEVFERQWSVKVY
jgi:galactose mutarotase-like enzyme